MQNFIMSPVKKLVQICRIARRGNVTEEKEPSIQKSVLALKHDETAILMTGYRNQNNLIENLYSQIAILEQKSKSSAPARKASQAVIETTRDGNQNFLRGSKTDEDRVMKITTGYATSSVGPGGIRDGLSSANEEDRILQSRLEEKEFNDDSSRSVLERDSAILSYRGSDLENLNNRRNQSSLGIYNQKVQASNDVKETETLVTKNEFMSKQNEKLRLENQVFQTRLESYLDFDNKKKALEEELHMLKEKYLDLEKKLNDDQERWEEERKQLAESVTHVRDIEALTHWHERHVVKICNLREAIGPEEAGNEHPPGLLNLTLPPVAGKWRLVRSIGSGGGGNVFEAMDLTNEESVVAVKLEEIKPGQRSFLEVERQVYRFISAFIEQGVAVDFMPKGLFFGGYNQNYRALVMNRLGPSVDKHWKSFNFRFTLTGTLAFGIKALKCLEKFHDYGFVHRDVKAANFLTDREGNGELYLTDFGFAKHYGQEWQYPPGQEEFFFGTTRYASRAAHRKEHQSRASDLESLGYTMVELFGGLATLPWGPIADPNGHLGPICLMKEHCPVEELCNGVPAFLKFFEVVEALAFSERPDYNLLRETLTSGQAGLDEHLDWIRYNYEVQD